MVKSMYKDIDYMCTLEAYVHRMLTGKRVLGIGDAAGMFPVDSEKKITTRKWLRNLINW